MRFMAPMMLLPLIAFGCTSEPPGVREINVDNYDDAPFTAERVRDTHSQVGVPAVDVLWVVDNSRSMFEEQQALANNFTSFMRYFEESGMDYQIAVMSTGWDSDDERGQLRTTRDRRDNLIRWITPETSEPDKAFREMALMGTDGPLEEKGRAQVYTALELLGNDANFGFVREDAFLSVIVVSDEDDASGDVPISEERFITWMEGLKGDVSQVSFSSIVGPDGGCGNAIEGTSYLHLTRTLGGVEHPICDLSWSRVLEDIGLQAAGLRDEFQLSRIPDPESIEVSVKSGPGQAKPLSEYNWIYVRSRNSIQVLDDVPPPESKIFIEYDVMQTDAE